MKFQAHIRTPDGGRRMAEFESPYDATSVLVEHVEREVLVPGESIMTCDSRTLPNPRDRRHEMVPRIERIA